jgi:hypothetical protein
VFLALSKLLDVLLAPLTWALLLALGAALGLLLFAAVPVREVGVGIAGVALASMLLASIVLLTSSPKLWRAAVLQGTAPFIALVFGVLWTGLEPQPSREPPAVHPPERTSDPLGGPAVAVPFGLPDPL